MLNSFEIAAALSARGFSRTLTKKERTKAHGYKSPLMKNPLYVRMLGVAGDIQPEERDPLVLHPEDAERIRSKISHSSGIKLNHDTRASSAYVGFPNRVQDGKTLSPEGVRVGIQDLTALDALLALLVERELPSMIGVTAPLLPDTARSSTPHSPTEVYAESTPATGEYVEKEPALPTTLLARASTYEVDSDPQCQGVSETTRIALINARMGQGGYRRRMLKMWQGRCAVTGCTQETVLIASHAKSWVSASNEERLDAYNGLLLTASIDRLFDRGLISFDDDGQLLRKPGLTDADLACLGLQPDARLREVHPRNLPYLAAHRHSFGF